MAKKTSKGLAKNKPARKTVVIIRITHYPIDDPEWEEDYYDVELQDANGKTIAEFGDYYHDKGLEKAEGFISGVEYALGIKVKVEMKNVADREI